MGLMNIRRIIMNSAPQEEPQTVTVGPSAIATFDTNWAVPMKSVKVNIDPIQDLHGQANPYPPGGSKNLIDADDFSGNTSESVRQILAESVTLNAGTYTLSWTQTANITGNTRNTPYYLIGSSSTYAYASDNAYLGSGRKSWTFTFSEETTVTLGFWTNAITPACDYVDFQLEAGSSATSYAPYSNICPISGRTEVNVGHTGKNIFNANDWDHSGITPSDRFVVVSDSSIQLTSVGYMERGNSYVPGKAMPKTFSFKTRTIVTSGNSPSFKVSYRKEDGALTALKTVSLGTSVGNEQEFTISIPSDAVSLHFGSWSYTGTILLYDMQMEFTDATTYEPYKGESITIDLGQTVYGGTLDVLSSELVIDRAMVDLGDMTWSYYGGFFRLRSLPSEIKRPISTTTLTTAISSAYHAMTWTAIQSTDNGAFAVSSGSDYPIFANTAYTDATTFKTAMDGVQFCYELATPITVQLTPQEIRSFLGGNNVWADSGDTEVTYYTR